MKIGLVRKIQRNPRISSTNTQYKVFILNTIMGKVFLIFELKRIDKNHINQDIL